MSYCNAMKQFSQSSRELHQTYHDSEYGFPIHHDDELYGSFERWIEHHHPLTKEEWVKIFKKTFKFTGGEIVNEFLTSIGVLPHAHDESCPIYEKTLKANPLWLKYPCSTHIES